MVDSNSNHPAWSGLQSPLDHAYRWEHSRPLEPYLVQPLGGGQTRTYTWGQTMDEARRLATWLQGLDLPPGSRVAMLTKNCAQFFIFDLAVWMAGHVSVALYPTLPAETIRYILEHCDAKVLFVGKLDDWDRQRDGVPEPVRCIACDLSPATDFLTWESIVMDRQPLQGQPTPPGSATAMLIYTSGTTGVPKGVELQFGAIAAAAEGFVAEINIDHHDRMLSYLPLAHAFERAVVEAASLRAGFQVFFAETLSTFLADVRRARPTIFHSVPRLWRKFQEGVQAKLPAPRLRLLLSLPIVGNVVRKKVLAGLGLECTRMAVTGSAPVPAELITWYRRLGLELCEGYGMTENFSYSHFNRPGRVVVGSVGTPAPRVQCRISDDGEILVNSPATMKGYYREPEQTAAAFTSDGFLRTGDRGHIDADGSLHITGRTKELFKTAKGKYIAPAPIENAILADGPIEQVCVLGSGDPQPYALVVLGENVREQLTRSGTREPVERDLVELLDRVNARLEAHERLLHLVVVKEPWTVENGLLTPSLKVRRAEVEQHYGSRLHDLAAQGREAVVWEP